MQINEEIKKRINFWLNGPFDENTKNEIKKLKAENSAELISCFSNNLKFGTGGIRAKMGVGTNRLNKYTICMATQALCNYIKKTQNQKKPVIIGFDNRKNSSFFAEEAAKVLAANNIKVFLFKELRPTPLISFGCRYKKCIAAIMITASHNPKEYNGYKVYWEDGAQVLPPHDTAIIAEYNKIDSFEKIKILDSVKSPLIEIITDEIDLAYMKELFSMELFNKKITNPKLKIVYSNLHGTGITLIPKCLNEYGFKDVILVKEQSDIDPDFTNVEKPNPEEKKALELGIKYLQNNSADIFIVTDPDADRIAAIAKHKNEAITLTGNQIACIMLDFLCRSNKLKNAAAIKTIVTTELFQKICAHFKVKCFDVLTGFKYIAEKIYQWEKNGPYSFLFGAEESLGYLIETFVRDKDAISAALLISKIALLAKEKDKTLIDLLYEIYGHYGVFREKLFSFAFDTSDGMQKMQDIMQKMRSNPPQIIENKKVEFVDDYKTSKRLEIKTSKTLNLSLPKSDVLTFWLEDKSKIVIRPSGTEPKIKIYIEMQKLNSQNIEKDIVNGDKYLDILFRAIRVHIKI